MVIHGVYQNRETGLGVVSFFPEVQIGGYPGFEPHIQMMYPSQIDVAPL